MKKQIVLATIATLATTSAYATKARMNALGQRQDRGSFYINDTRNVFRNAARVNQTNNYTVTEWGEPGVAGTENAPNAEGGFFKNAGSFNYGVYLGNKSQDKTLDAAPAGYADTLGGAGGVGEAYGNAGFLDRSNDLDLFFGGDMGVEWGLNLHYASSKNDAVGTTLEQTYSNLALGLGIVMGDLNAYINYTLSDEAEGIGTAAAGFKAEDDGSMNIGFGYNMMDLTFFVDYDKDAISYTGGTGVAAVTTEQTVLTVGAGYTKEVSSTSRMFTDLSYVSTSAEDSSATAASVVEASTSTLPLTVGFETDATSWLTLRGSISQNIFVNSAKVKVGTGAEVKTTNGNTTDVQAGATLNFGKLMIDGMIGTQAGIRNGAPGTDAGVLATDNLMTQVAVHYWF